MSRDSSGAVEVPQVPKKLLTAYDRNGWYECRKIAPTKPPSLVVRFWNGDDLFWGPDETTRATMANYTDFVLLVPARDLSEAAAELQERWHKMYRPEIVHVPALVRDAVEVLAGVAPADTDKLERRCAALALRCLDVRDAVNAYHREGTQNNLEAVNAAVAKFMSGAVGLPTFPDRPATLTEAIDHFTRYLKSSAYFPGSYADCVPKVVREAEITFGRLPPGTVFTPKHPDFEAACAAISNRIHSAGCWEIRFVSDVVIEELSRVVIEDAPAVHYPEASASNPRMADLWAAVMGVVRAAGNDPSQMIDCPAVSKLSDVAVEFAKAMPAVTEARECPECAKLAAELKAQKEGDEILIKTFGKALCAISEIALGSPSAWSAAEEAGSGLETLVEGVRTIKDNLRKATGLGPVEIIDGPARLAAGLWVVQENSGRVLPLLVPAHWGEVINDGWRAIKVVDSIPNFPPRKPAKKPFELPPPGTAFHVRLPDGTKRECYRFSDGRIGNQVKTWEPDEFLALNPEAAE